MKNFRFHGQSIPLLYTRNALYKLSKETKLVKFIHLLHSASRINFVLSCFVIIYITVLLVHSCYPDASWSLEGGKTQGDQTQQKHIRPNFHEEFIDALQREGGQFPWLSTHVFSAMFLGPTPPKKKTNNKLATFGYQKHHKSAYSSHNSPIL